MLAGQAAADARMGLNVMSGGVGRSLALGSSGRRTPLERATAGGESPVAGPGRSGVRHEREYHRTREIRWEAGSPTTQG